MSSVNQNGAHPQGCLSCQLLAQELVKRQEKIDELQAKLDFVHNMTRSSNNAQEVRVIKVQEIIDRVVTNMKKELSTRLS